MAWFLEHPTEGICTAVPADKDDNWHFAWSINRDNERRRNFWRLDYACKMLRKAPEGTMLMRDNGINFTPRYQEETRRA